MKTCTLTLLEQATTEVHFIQILLFMDQPHTPTECALLLDDDDYE